MTRIPPFAVLALAAVSILSLPARADDAGTLVAHWNFSTSPPEGVEPAGEMLFLQPGPRPPEFPGMPKGNQAAWFNGKGAGLKVLGGGDNSDFQFTNGDAITLEAWVKLDQLAANQQVYVIGKGRSENPKFGYGNQNWSLRLANTGGKASIDFLFCTRPPNVKAQWHRWRSTAGFLPGTGWHLIAVTYRFGDPESIRGWIDGEPTAGAWDLAGPTREPPVVDADDVWIGTSMNRKPHNSFHGSIDELAVHRTLATDETFKGKFRREGGALVVAPQKEVMPELGDIPAGQVHFSLAEGLPAHDRWLYEGEKWPTVTTRWSGHEFLLPRIPVRYDDWGIRTRWKSPLLLRIAADVELPAGKQQFLFRGRGLGRLWIDGRLVARTQADTVRLSGGRNPIVLPASPPLPGLRAVGGNVQEVFADAEIDATPDRLHRVVVELVVGGPRVRTETGEVCVALLADEGRTYHILQPHAEPALPLTDAAVEAALERIEASLVAHDDRVRRQAAASQNSFWDRRHAMAREWGEENPAPSVPGPAGAHPIDAFVEAKIATARKSAAESDPAKTRHFYDSVLPILRENCIRCHGDKEQGGLKLNSRERILLAGDSEQPAVVPGKPEMSEIIARIESDDDSLRMPPTGKGLKAEEIRILKDWIRDGAEWPAPPASEEALALAPLTDDETFLRRIYLDLVGVPPTAAEAADFLADASPDKRTTLIDRLLADDRVADHALSEWQDLLAENPTLLLATLNSSGPFRWFLYDALRDNKPLDRMVTELILMRGSSNDGGSAGFAVAAENDSPFAAKGHILASTFLAIELQCARCHDSPYHSTLQKDLYALGAMLSRKSLTVPKTSQVPAAFFEKQARESLIKVSLKPNESIPAEWPFADETGVIDGPHIDRLMQSPKDSRERLAALITSPENARFARVTVNRVWKRLIGAGFVEPVHDWEGRTASHPELLDWLAREFMAAGYDLRALTRLIVTSQTYQREAVGKNLAASPELRFFNAPDRRRLTAEQVVDSLHAVTRKRMESEELTFDPEGREDPGVRLTLGRPTRAWMMADLKNERDRPSLSLPQARAIADVLEAFGWTGSRQQPITERETDPNVLQPGILANGILSLNLASVSAGSALADQALDAESPEALVETLFLQVLTRRPRPDEYSAFVAALSPGFEQRRIPDAQVQPPTVLPPLPQITWFNHVKPEANEIQIQKELRVRQGPPADPRIRPEWRGRFEDVLWSLINHRDFVWIP